jgi:hypothetical protein
MVLPLAQLEKTGSTSPTLNDLIAIWAAVTKDGNHACGSLSPKEKGTSWPCSSLLFSATPLMETKICKAGQAILSRMQVRMRFIHF